MNLASGSRKGSKSFNQLYATETSDQGAPATDRDKKDQRALATTAVNEVDVGFHLDDDQENRENRFWATTGDRTVFWAASDVVENIIPGLYKTIDAPKIGPALLKMIISTDDLILIDSVVKEEVFSEIMYFWSDEVRQKFKERGFLYKRGILMYGDPGSGKTACIQLLIKEIIKHGGIALYGDRPDIMSQCLQMVRRIEPNVPVVVIMEDFEILTERGHAENEWLAMLDGESQVDNVVFLGTTNYVEKLDKRFTDRPSRFDVVVSVPPPSAEIRATFLHHKEPSMPFEEVQHWVTLTAGFSIAHLKELVISVRILGKPLDEQVKRLRKMMERGFTNKEFEGTAKGEKRTSVGFRTTRDDSEYISDEKIDWDAFKKSRWV